MKKKYFIRNFSIFIVFFLVLMLPSIAMASDWACFQKDNYNTGVTADRAPINYTDPIGNLSWEQKLGGNIDSSPLAYGDMMYVLAGNNHIYAFNKTTGASAWEESTSGSGGFVIGTAAVGNGLVFVPTSDGKVFAFNAETGAQQWSTTPGSGKQLDTPITYSEDKIYFGEAMGGHKYYCLNASSGEEIWNRTSTTQTSGQGSYYWAGATVIGDNLVYGDDDGYLVSVNKNNGNQIAEINVSQEFGVTCGKIRSSVLYVEELKRIYFTSVGGYCFALGFNEAEGTFNLSSKYNINFGGSSTSTPAYYNGRIYIGTGQSLGIAGHGIYCFNADLTSTVWNYECGTVQASPAISSYYDDGDGEAYIYFTINNNSGGIYCLKDYTGCTTPELVWNYADSSKTSYSVAGVAISEGWVYFGADNKYIFGLTTGEEQQPPDNNNTNSTHSISINVTVIENPDTENSSAWAQFHKDATHTGFSAEESPDTNNSLWVSDSIWAIPSSSPVIAEGKVFVKCGFDESFNDLMSTSSTEYRIVVLNESTGEYLANYSLGELGISWSSPCYYNGTIWCGRGIGAPGGATAAAGKIFDSNSTEYRYYCTDAETKVELWNFTVTGSIQGTAAYSDGKVYMASGNLFEAPGYVYCVYAENGTEIWNKTVSSEVSGSPAVSDGVVYISTYFGNLYALNAENGAEIWNKTLETTDVSSTPAVAYGNVYISGGYPGYGIIKTYCFNASSGNLVWSTSADDEIGGWSSSVAVADGKVFAGKHAGSDYFGHNTTLALNASNGDVIWTAPYGGASPAISDGTVFTIGDDGRVYAFADKNSTGPEGSPETIYNGTVTLKKGNFTYVPSGNLSAIYEWSNLTDLGALVSTGLNFTTSDLSYGSFWINSLAGIENENYSVPNAKSWSIIINGEAASSGLGGNTVSDGDTISFYYLPWDGMTPLLEEATYVVNITVNEITDNENPEVWYQFHKDAAHTGFSPGNASDTNSLLWVSNPIDASISSSVVIANGKVFVNCGNGSCCCDNDTEASSSTAKIIALNEYTGDSLYICGSGSDRYGSWASPCYDAGKVWCGLTESVDGGTMVADGKVYAGNYDGQNYDGHGQYFCFAEDTNEELWNFTVPGYAQATPAYSDGKVFLTSGTHSSEGNVYCVDASSGIEIWSKSLPQDALGSPAVSNGVVYVTTFAFGNGDGLGSIYALYAENGSEVWSATIQATDSTPAIAYGNVYVAAGCSGYNPIQTYCFNATTGSLVWNTSAEEKLGGWTLSVAVADNKVFVGKCTDGDLYGYYGLYALNSTTGETVWNTPYGGSSPAISDGIVFTIGADGRVYAFADPTELDLNYSVPGTGLPLDTEVLPAVSIEFNRSDLSFGTLSPGENCSLCLNIKNNGKYGVKVSTELGEGSNSLYENYLFLDSTLCSQYSKLISSKSAQEVELVLNVPGDYDSGSEEVEGNLIFWAEAEYN